MDLLEKAREKNGLPPHTTHLFQHLDVALFKPLKSKFFTLAMSLGYANIIRNWSLANRGMNAKLMLSKIHFLILHIEVERSHASWKRLLERPSAL
jgi:hypothetical protein